MSADPVSRARRQPDAEALPADAALLGVRKELLRELTGTCDTPGRIFAGRYFLTIVPLACAAAALTSWPNLGTALAFAIVAGFTQNALGVLMHEGSHCFFHRDRRVNDALANVLVCLPVFNTVAGYRDEHFPHHRRSGTEEDPYYDLYGRYRRSEDVTRGLMRDLLGISAVRAFLRRYGSRAAGDEAPRRSAGSSLGTLVALATVQGGIAAALWAMTGWPFAWLLLWVFPLMTIPVAVNRMRTLVEHYPGLEGIPANRTTLTGVVEYLCVAPYGYSYHFEHHFAPSIPYYRLRWAHEFLEARGVELASRQCNRSGYFGAFRVMMRELARTSARGG
jgi:fatty acid desaturase